MLFTTWTFWVFLVVVLSLFYAAPRTWKRYILLLASFYFYMSWNARFVFLLLALITIDYAAAIWIDRFTGVRRRGALILSLLANLGFLGWFKYTNFAIATWTSLFHPGAHPPLLNIILPLGISFHTFQSISYVVDVYRGEQPAVTQLHRLRAVRLLLPATGGRTHRARPRVLPRLLRTGAPPRLSNGRRGVLPDPDRAGEETGLCRPVRAGGGQILSTIPRHSRPRARVDRRRSRSRCRSSSISPATPTSRSASALLFGFHFPENFRAALPRGQHHRILAPLAHVAFALAARLTSTSRSAATGKGTCATYRNLMLTMLLGGLWHGASWTFLVWGAYHGALLSLERVAYGRRNIRGIARAPLTIATFLLVCVGWVWFRAATFHSAWYVQSQMFQGTGGASLLSGWEWFMAALTLLIALGEEYGALLTRLYVAPAWIRTVAVVILLLTIEIFGVTGLKIPFVYFQF